MAATNSTAERTYRAEESRWQAVQAREIAADGAFYYAVRSTGVYCRPSCPSRRPGRDQVVFFEAPEAARQAGFRACLRCHPDSVSADQLAVAKALHLIEASETDLTLRELARDVRLSPAYLQRVFKRQTGLTPKQYALELRRQRFRQDLRSSKTVTEAVYNAGFGSTRAAYERAGEQLGMRPSAFRQGGRGERITYAIAEGDLGHMLVAATERGLCAVYLGTPDEVTHELEAEFPRADLVEDASAMSGHVGAVKDAVKAGVRDSGLQLDVHGSEFQRRVWAALREIPAGQTRTYRQIAEAIGQPSAARAVARACATNPLALLTPCHRVVRSDGRLGGYRWGLGRKQALLRSEGAVR